MRALRGRCSVCAWLLLLAAAGCGDDGEAPATEPDASAWQAPKVRAVRLSETLLPALHAGELYTLGVEFDYEATDTDLAFALIGAGADGGVRSELVDLGDAPRSGTGAGTLALDDSFAPGGYDVSVEVIDAEGVHSEAKTARFEIREGAPAEFAIAELTPAAGAPGDVIVITGSGLVADDLGATDVRFGNALAHAEVTSAAEDRLEVVVPRGATSGPVAVQSERGVRRSAQDFEVAHTITLTPDRAQLVVGRSLELECRQAGTTMSEVVWTLDGKRTDSNLGSMDARGNYVAPDSVPSSGLVTVRCASVSEPEVFAETQITVVPEVSEPGAGVVAPAGGEVRSREGEVVVTFPSGAVSKATPFRIEPLDPATLPALSEDHRVLAAARFPEPARLASEAVLSFALPSWVAPGSELALLEYDEMRAKLDDEGRTAVVDESGMLAVGSVPHFSVWTVQEVAARAHRRAEAALFAERYGSASEWTLAFADGLGAVEGLRSPVLVSHRDGPGAGLGPFTAGVRASWYLAGRDEQHFASVVQPSGDGWALGVVLDLPVLPNCVLSLRLFHRFSLTVFRDATGAISRFA